MYVDIFHSLLVMPQKQNKKPQRIPPPTTQQHNNKQTKKVRVFLKYVNIKSTLYTCKWPVCLYTRADPCEPGVGDLPIMASDVDR